MRTTVTLDQDVYEAAMHLSRASGKRLGKVLSELARRGIKQQPPAPKKRKRGEWKWPTVDVPPDAPVIPASRIQRILDEEGYF